jgi:hypothetical protein
MRDSDERYDLYRVYSMSGAACKLRVAKNLRHFAVEILKLLEGLPSGVTADGFSVDPSALEFGEDIVIRRNGPFESDRDD